MDEYNWLNCFKYSKFYHFGTAKDPDTIIYLNVYFTINFVSQCTSFFIRTTL